MYFAGAESTDKYNKQSNSSTGKKVSSLFLKLDISKAFDSIAWSFLLEILDCLGFGPRWKTLIVGPLVYMHTG
jgi:hypothetical protein